MCLPETPGSGSFTAADFTIRLSDRDAWIDFMRGEAMNFAAPAPFLQVIDKMERENPDVTAAKLEGLGTSREAVGQWTGRPPLRPVPLGEVIGAFSYVDIPIPTPAPL